MSAIDSEQTARPPVLVNGVHIPATAAAIKAAAPTSSCYTFTAPYVFTVRGSHLAFRKGQTYSLSPDVKAALLAASAPMQPA